MHDTNYKQYTAVVSLWENELHRPHKIKTLQDAFLPVFTGGHGATENRGKLAIMKIYNECGFHDVMAAAWLWSVTSSMAGRPSTRMEFSDKTTIPQAWATLIDLHESREAARERRFTQWTSPDSDWETFYQRTIKFIQECRTNKISFSQLSLYIVAKHRDDTMSKLNECPPKLEPMEYFNRAMAWEMVLKRKSK